jgi:hypothetical protein
MSQIDDWPARSFFADLLIPLQHANTRRHKKYLSRASDTTSYWRPPLSRTGGSARLSAAACDGSTLLQMLAQYWAAQDDRELPKLLPHLLELHRQIVAPHARADTEETHLPEFIYALF